MTNCAYCHGEDARGGENGGTNLLRSDYVMRDRTGEVLDPFLKSATANEHKFAFTTAQVADIAAFIHEFKINSRDPGRMRPPTVVVGDAKAGQAYFQSKCASCHSVTGDLKGIATRIDDPRSLQQTWLMPLIHWRAARWGHADCIRRQQSAAGDGYGYACQMARRWKATWAASTISSSR